MLCNVLEDHISAPLCWVLHLNSCHGLGPLFGRVIPGWKIMNCKYGWYLIVKCYEYLIFIIWEQTFCTDGGQGWLPEDCGERKAKSGANNTFRQKWKIIKSEICRIAQSDANNTLSKTNGENKLVQCTFQYKTAAPKLRYNTEEPICTKQFGNQNKVEGN